MKRTLSIILALVLAFAAVPVFATEEEPMLLLGTAPGPGIDPEDHDEDLYTGIDYDPDLANGIEITYADKEDDVFDVVYTRPLDFCELKESVIGPGIEWNPDAENGGKNPVLTMSGVQIDLTGEQSEVAVSEDYAYILKDETHHGDKFSALCVPDGTSIFIDESCEILVDDQALAAALGIKTSPITVATAIEGEGKLSIETEEDLYIEVISLSRASGIVVLGEEAELTIDAMLDIYAEGPIEARAIYVDGDADISGMIYLEAKADEQAYAVYTTGDLNTTFLGVYDASAPEGSACAVYGNKVEMNALGVVKAAAKYVGVAIAANEDITLNSFLNVEAAADLAIGIFSISGDLNVDGMIIGEVDGLTKGEDVFLNEGEIKLADENCFVEIDVLGVNCIPFYDVDKDDERLYEAVTWAWENGYMRGTSSRSFSPEAELTRAEMITIFYRLAGCPRIGDPSVYNAETVIPQIVLDAKAAGKTDSQIAALCPFTDITAGKWDYDAIVWAWSIGLTNGTSASTFSPKEICSAGMLSDFIARGQGIESGSWKTERQAITRGETVIKLYDELIG